MVADTDFLDALGSRAEVFRLQERTVRLATEVYKEVDN